jgi:hypothetical protein
MQHLGWFFLYSETNCMNFLKKMDYFYLFSCFSIKKILYYRYNKQQTTENTMKKQTIKLIALINTHRGRNTLWVGTLDQMTKSFSYTLECGNSWNCKIKTADQIKSIKSLVSNLKKSVNETQGGCYDRDRYEEAMDCLTDEVKAAWEKQQTEYASTYKKTLED